MPPRQPLRDNSLDDLANEVASAGGKEKEEEKGPAPIGGYDTGIRQSTSGKVPGSRVAAGDLGYDVVPASYFEGDEWSLAAAMPEEDIAMLQEAMYNADLYADNPNIVFGYWQREDARAMYDLLSYANANGVTWRNALERAKSARDRFGTMQDRRDALKKPTGGGGGGGGGGPRLPEVADLRLVVDQVTQKVLGRRLNDAQAVSFAEQYRNSMLAPPAGQPSASVPDAIDYRVRNDLGTAEAGIAAGQLPAEAQATDLANTFDMFRSILGGMR